MHAAALPPDILERLADYVPPRPDVSHLVTEDDTPVDNFPSEKLQRLLTETLYTSWSGPPPLAAPESSLPDASGSNATPAPRTFLAAANVGLFSTLGVPLVPDVFLSVDVSVAPEWWKKEHRSYFFWEFGKAPDVVIEIVSNREGGELDRKRRDYARVGVAYYVVWDPQALLGPERLYVLERRGGLYVPLERAWFEDIGLGLVRWVGTYEGYETEWLRWCDRDGKLLPTGAERARSAEEQARGEQERADVEQQRADAEQQRADAERQRADAEQQRADAERQRANAQRQRAEAAERRAELLARRLKELGVDPAGPEGDG